MLRFPKYHSHRLQQADNYESVLKALTRPEKYYSALVASKLKFVVQDLVFDDQPCPLRSCF